MVVYIYHQREYLILTLSEAPRVTVISKRWLTQRGAAVNIHLVKKQKKGCIFVNILSF